MAPIFTRDRTIRVATIWQTPHEGDIGSELYLYDVPEAVYYEACPSHNGRLSSDQPYLLVQGE